MATWEQAGVVRRNFADMVDGLTAEQLEQQSLCTEWTARGVLGHLTSFVETGALTFISTMVKCRFDFDKVSIDMTNTQLRRPTTEVIAALRAKATKSAALPMFPEELTVSDTVIHTQDVRRPLGLPGEIDASVLRQTLDFLTTHKMATTLVNRRPLDDVRLVASDLDWSFGSGPEITGAGEALVMALANRPVLDELAGGGLAAWQ